MGTRSKPPVEIESNSQGGTEVQPQDGLPPFKRYIDIQSEWQGQRAVTRLFLATPSDKDVADTENVRDSKEFVLTVVAANISRKVGAKATTPLFQHCKNLGFSNDFAIDLVRLLIKHLQGKHRSKELVFKIHQAYREFVKFLALQSQRPVKLTDIDKEIWKDFLAVMEADQRKASKDIFNCARKPFTSYGPTSHSGWLGGIPFREKRRTKPSPEHSSELAETRDYSDVVMYQLLCLFIYDFERRMECMKRYQRISEADMPTDWLYPGRRRKKLPGKENLYDTTELLRQWLRDEGAGYEVLIDHYLMHHKAGLITENKYGRLFGGVAVMLSRLRSNGGDDKALVTKFQEEMGGRHGYDSGPGGVGLLSFYLKKKTPTEANAVISKIGWCLANLLMMQAGVNKEVVLTIPSKAEDGKSILTRADTLFVKKDGAETEINMYGTKAKTGRRSSMKVIPVIIVKNSPIYEMLVDYERHVKVGDGPFFEFNSVFKQAWNTSGQKGSISEGYEVTDENGRQLSSIDTPRFRKVFVSGQLLDRMKNIKDMNELAESIRNDVHHGNLDVTLTNYIMKSSVGRSVIDIAIATIIGGKLNDLKCKSQIEGRKPVSFKKKVFLCHCADPQNPSHDVAIADECRHYDLCLGCEQSIITKEHLPYVCLRIIQYEFQREKDPRIWPAVYEDRWCIARDALDRYIEKDKRNGRRLVAEAWITARQGHITLPPIIAPNRM